MSTLILVAALITVATIVAFVIVRGGTPSQTIASMLRPDDKEGARK